MTPVEIIAFITSILILVKVLVIIIKPKGIISPLQSLIAKERGFMACVYGIIFLVVGYFIIQEMSVIQIVAVMLFSSSLMGMIFMKYPASTLSLFKESIQKPHWIGLIISVILAISVLIAIF